DLHHLGQGSYGLKVNSTNTLLGKAEFFEDAETLINGVNPSANWGPAEIVKMYNLPLAPGVYSINLDIIAGTHDLGISLFSSAGGNYIRTLSQALANADYYGNGGGESFVVSIPSADIYGLCVYAETYEAISNSTTFRITVGSPGLWTGVQNNLWNNPANWSNGQVPSSSDAVYISATAPNQPRIAGGVWANCKNLSIPRNASLEIANGGMTVSSGSATIAGMLSITNSAAQINFNGHVTWQNYGQFHETAGGIIRARGNWVVDDGASVLIVLSNMVMDGQESSVIEVHTNNTSFHDLQITKASGRSVTYSAWSTGNILILGNLTIQSAALFIGDCINTVQVQGNLSSLGGLRMNHSTMQIGSSLT
ncbi:MAG: hypothetical protein U1C33_08780, partial [Candidatus Cloacimonadaceae bacterium]|nr:hypothetical protein [Candidatus Cloacimonadaceae bacterium]